MEDTNPFTLNVLSLEGSAKIKHNDDDIWKLTFFKQVKSDDKSLGKLFYFADSTSKEIVGFIDLSQSVEINANYPQIQIKSPEKLTLLQIETREEFDKWVNGINSWRSSLAEKFPLNGLLKMEDGKKRESRFVRQEKHRICFYKSQKDTSKLKGYLDLNLIIEIQREKSEFALVTHEKTVRFSADKKEQLDYWVNGISSFLNLQKNIKENEKKLELPGGGSFGKTTSASSQESLLEGKSGALSSFMDAFRDRKMDFEVKVHIMEAEDLVFNNAKQASDLVCDIQVVNKSDRTKKVNGTTKCTWDHHISFKFTKLVEEFFTLGNFKVSVFGGKTEDEIGSFDIDLGSIYNNDGHELYNKWVVLMDYNNLEKGKGFLKLSVSVLAEGDVPKLHNKEDDLQEFLSFNDIQSAALLPPSLKNEIEDRQRVRLTSSLESTAEEISPVVQRAKGIALLEAPQQLERARKFLEKDESSLLNSSLLFYIDIETFYSKISENKTIVLDNEALECAIYLHQKYLKSDSKFSIHSILSNSAKDAITMHFSEGNKTPISVFRVGISEVLQYLLGLDDDLTMVKGCVYIMICHTSLHLKKQNPLLEKFWTKFQTLATGDQNQGWKNAKSKKGVLMQILDDSKAGEFTFVRGSTVMPVSVDQMWTFVSSIHLRTHWDQLYNNGKLVSVIDEETHSRVSVFHYKAPMWAFAYPSQDFAIFMTERKLPDGTILVGSASISHPDAPPRKGVVRSLVSLSGWYLQPHSIGSQCSLVYLGGSKLKSVPKWAEKFLLIARPLFNLMRIRDFLHKNVIKKNKDINELAKLPESLTKPLSPGKTRKAPVNSGILEVEKLEKVGSGNFGTVFKGVWNESLVALKQLTSSGEHLDVEAKILTKLRHPNIVSYFGVTSIDDMDFLMMEFMPLGSVKEFLESRSNNMEVKDLIQISRAIDASSGMIYIGSQGIVHRDLALRNLLAKQEENKVVVKIGDFGLARNLYGSDFYKAESSTFAIKWAAPESVLNSSFSVQSDIWSFGVTLWELFEYGRTPYPLLSNKEAFDEVLKGKRLGKPEICPEKIYDMMQECWEKEPSKRPTFDAISIILTQALKLVVPDHGSPTASRKLKDEEEDNKYILA